MDKLIEFLQSQKLLVIASHNEKEVWIANVYFGSDDKGILYFIGRDTTKHSKMILENPSVAFSIAWFDPENHKNRKAVQGLGECRPTENEQEIEMGVRLHNQNFPEFKSTISVDWVDSNEFGSKVWVLKPNYMKFWNDELYGPDGTKEFVMS